MLHKAIMAASFVSLGRIGGSTKARGFTLIEIVLATALLAFGLTLAFATLRTATGSIQRGEALMERSESIRAVQAFLRRQLGNALALPFARDPTTNRLTLFTAAADTVSFTSTMPGYLARGGVYKQTLRLARDGRHYRLEFDYRMLVSDQLIEPPNPPPAEVLVRDVAEASLEFQGIDADGAPGEWTRTWETPDRLPSMARIKLRFVDPRRHWPELAVPLQMGRASGGYATGSALNVRAQAAAPE